MQKNSLDWNAHLVFIEFLIAANSSSSVYEKFLRTAYLAVPSEKCVWSQPIVVIRWLAEMQSSSWEESHILIYDGN